jgi:hypothetical protein
LARTIVFKGIVRRWREDAPGGLAVVDVPAELVPALGGRRQRRVEGTLQGRPFAGSTMLVAGGGFCVGLSRAALRAAGADVGEAVELALELTTSRPAVDSGEERSSSG